MTLIDTTSPRASSLRCTIARSARDIAAAQRVRWRVYGEEEQLLAPAVACGDREIDARDDRGTTTHFVVHAGGEPVGTLRLLECERNSDGDAEPEGLALESKFRFPALLAPGIVRAEVTRFCVVRRYRGTEAAKLLFLSLYAESRRRGITHWVAGANTGTDYAEDAALMFRVAEQRSLVDLRFRADLCAVEDAATPRRRPGYGEEERRLGCEGRCEGLALPRTLSLYANKMGARYVGPPAYDPYFGVFALPLVAPLGGP